MFLGKEAGDIFPASHLYLTAKPQAALH